MITQGLKQEIVDSMNSIQLQTKIEIKYSGSLLSIEVAKDPSPAISLDKVNIIFDQNSSRTCDFFAKIGNETIGEVRLKFDMEPTYVSSIVNSSDSFSHIGKALIEFSTRLSSALSKGGTLELCSEEDAIGFYTRLGFEPRPEGDGPLDLRLDPQKLRL